MSNTEHIIIVSGSVRSGTSLMMQLLEAGGVPLYYDDSKPPDENNPYGYFEKTGMFAYAGLGGAESPFLTFCKNKGVKILPPSILPDVIRDTKGTLVKIIFMLRDENEVANSYLTMIENLNRLDKPGSLFHGLTREESIEKFKETRRANIQSALDFFNSEENTADVLVVNHNDLILNSLETLTQISDFIRADLPQYEMNPQTMVEIVDIDLYRQRQSMQP
jgi:RNase adaptor protein for sRNA GlmZ degradation